jgi:hypothetical protein
VRFTDFSAFKLHPGQDVILHYKRKHPWLQALIVGGLLVFFVSAAVWMSNPDWNPGPVRGKGAGVIALLLLLPAIVRGILLVLLIGFLAEGSYRNACRMYDGEPDFLIGPSGIADLNPWRPQAILWDDVVGITRAWSSLSLFTQQKVLSIHVRAPGRKPTWIPPWFWKFMPARLTEREVVLFPDQLGMTEEEVFRIVERFGGRFPVDDYYPAR